MKGKRKKIAGLVIILLNLFVLVNGIYNKDSSDICSAIAFIVLGTIFLLEKPE
jgi:hypothetical protein